MTTTESPSTGRPPLHGISEIRAFLRTNATPVFFISPTAFNLLGIDRWIRNFFYVTYFDSFGGTHPRVFVPRNRERRDFTSMEDVCNHLLRDGEVREWISSHGQGGKAVFVMFDGETEALAAEIGLEVAHPSAALRERLDSKIVTTQLGNEAGVPSVPNVLGRASSYTELLGLAADSDLGDDLVVQTPYGDSGKTTFFIAGSRDWDRHANELAAQELKVMRRIRNVEIAVEASITRHGTIVGPFMTSLIGYPELTPYKGGWCGNDIFPDALSPERRVQAREMTERLGARLAQEGYRGFFEVDFLSDKDTGELYLGELNPRVSGASSMTNVTAGAYADIPLFLFHLLEYLDVEYELDVDDINARWARTAGEDVWSQLIIKATDDDVELITAAPMTGVYKLDDRGRIAFARWANDWHNLIDESEAFYLRVAAAGDYRYKGADLGVLVTRGRLQTDDDRLTDRCRHWIDGITSQFAGTPITPADTVPLAGTSLKSGYEVA
jgi:biotin carboxylase